MTRYRIFSFKDTDVSIETPVIILACVAAAIRLEFFLLYVVCIALAFIHEVGHFLVAKQHGLKVPNIVFNFFGAATEVSMLLFAPPMTQLKIAAAGPLASLLTSVVLFGLSMLFPASTFLFNVALLNFVFIFFGNILPLYPLDGGRILLAAIMHLNKDKNYARNLDKMIIAQWYVGLFIPCVICLFFGWVYALVVFALAVAGLLMLLAQRNILRRIIEL